MVFEKYAGFLKDSDTWGRTPEETDRSCARPVTRVNVTGCCGHRMRRRLLMRYLLDTTVLIDHANGATGRRRRGQGAVQRAE